MRILLCIVLLGVLLLTACGGETNTSETAPDTHRAGFRSVCDVGRGIGAWVFTTDRYHEGYGFAIRMTVEEYSMECRKYE